MVAIALLAVAVPLGAHAQGTVPDLTGMWQAQGDTTSPAWEFTASNNRQTLDVTWRGGPGHASLRGTFHGTLAQNGGTPQYQGTMNVTEAGAPPVSGTMTITVVSATQVSVNYTQSNGVSQTILFNRTTPVPAEPTAPTTPATPTGPTIGPAGNPLGLPSNSQCIDARKFTFRLRRPQGAVVDVQVFINSVPTMHRKGANITTLTIARLPNRGRFKVRIEATSANGTKLISQRTYTRCKKSRAHGKKIKGRR
jgi:hypothetical protein